MQGLLPLVGPVQKRQIIELRRANQVGVLLAAMKAPPVQIREMIMKGEDNSITEDSLRTLIRLVPKDEEVELLTSFKGQPPEGMIKFFFRNFDFPPALHCFCYHCTTLRRTCFSAYSVIQCCAPSVRRRSFTSS